MYRVKDVSKDQVKEIMGELAQELESDGCTPAYVLGVLNGGEIPSCEFTEFLQKRASLLHYKLQRKSTGGLKSSVIGLIKLLPNSLVNLARSLEMALYSTIFREREVSGDDQACISFFKDKLDYSTIAVETPLVIVDDAIDTGKTIALIINSLLVLGVDRQSIKVVVIAHTLPNPVVRADYYYSDGVLFRFPWSGDI